MAHAREQVDLVFAVALLAWGPMHAWLPVLLERLVAARPDASRRPMVDRGQPRGSDGRQRWRRDAHASHSAFLDLLSHVGWLLYPHAAQISAADGSRERDTPSGLLVCF
jgi:hypothetical protein